MKKKNHYGYKVGYCKNGSRLFIRKFITRTHQQAHQMLVFYRKFGHQRVAQKFNYEIQPITKKEVLEGIWDELPFLYKRHGHYLYRWAHCSIVKTQSQREKIFERLPILLPLQKFLSFLADFGATLNSYMVCPFSLCYFGPADKGK